MPQDRIKKNEKMTKINKKWQRATGSDQKKRKNDTK